MNSTRHRVQFGRIATYAALVGWALVCGFPLYWLAIASIKPVEDLARPPTYLPFVDFLPALDAWRFILGHPTENLLSSLVNSLLIGGAAAATSLLAAGMMIYGLTRFQGARHLALGRGPHWLLALMLATRVVPPVVLALPIYMLANYLNLRDSRSLLICVYAAINLPVAIWLLLPVIGPRATDQEEAAQIDGATHIAIFFGILLPMLRGPAAVTGFLLFLLCWNEYLFAAYLAFDHAQTLSPWMVGQLSMKEAQAGGEAEELSRMAAAAVFMALPALALATAVQRLLARSLASRDSG